MTDNLRTKIAQAVMDSCHGVFLDEAVRAADAVIQELGLERETWNVDMGVSTLPRHMWVNPTPVTRYVTSWESE